MSCLSFTTFLTQSRWLGQSVPWMIEKHGGLEDFVVDPFGFKYQVRYSLGSVGGVGEDSSCLHAFLALTIFLMTSSGPNNSFSLLRWEEGSHDRLGADY